MKTRNRFLSMAIFGILAASCLQAGAQNAASPDPLKGPETSVARFGDWMLRCSSVQEVKTCELVQQLQQRAENGTQVPVALLAVGRVAKDQPLKFIAQLPSNITIAGGIAIETKPEKPILGSFVRCLPVGCFADVVLSEEHQKKWQQRKDAGQIVYRDGSERPVALPISFLGFSQAMAAMLKETR